MARGNDTQTTEADFEAHELPSGETVFYRDTRHEYFDRIEERPGGKWIGPRDAKLPSPSTIGKMLDTNTWSGR